MKLNDRTLQTNISATSVFKKNANFADKIAQGVADAKENWLSSWSDVTQGKNFVSDLLAGITVAAVALPLNLALAVSCGLPPSVGLVSGVVGGGLAAIFGGSVLQVTGPAAALGVMVLALVEKFGAAGASAACILIAGIQITLAFSGAGKWIQKIPEGVLAGFTTGVGFKLLDNQIPELLGFNYKVSDLFQMIHRPTFLHEVSWLAVVCGMFVAMLVISTRQFKRFPAALIGISIVTALSVYLNWTIERVGDVAGSLPDPQFYWIDNARLMEFATLVLPLGILAGIESLLSAQAIDRLTGAKRPFNANLELFGQSIANLGSGLFAGMPVSGVVVRSTVNVQSGGKTRMSAVIHSLVVILAMTVMSDKLSLIPLAALAGMLCVVALRLIEIKTLIELTHHNRVEALAFVVTAIGTLTGRLVTGLVLGLVIWGTPLLYKWYFKRRMLRNSSLYSAKRAEGDAKKKLLPGIRARIEQKSKREVWAGLSHFDPETMDAEGAINWLNQVSYKPKVPKSAFVHEQASLIGQVVLGEHVHIAAGSSVRADEGTPFYVGEYTNLQDGVVLHALKEKWVQVGDEKWAIYIGKHVSLAHQALIHGPSYIGDECFVGFKAIVHDSVIGDNCFIGHGAIVVGVELPPNKYVPPGTLVDHPSKVDDLPETEEKHRHFNEDVVHVNRGLVEAYRKDLIYKLERGEDLQWTQSF